MHMADALISPVVGGAMWAAAAGVAAYSARKVQKDLSDNKIPMMGVLGAAVFAAQMINFSIPGTGSSGHLGGGLILAILLGPYAGFLVMASILTIQALFFADGGLLALGCNIFNLGFYTCFVVYPLIYRPIVRKGLTRKRIIIGAMLAGIIGLQLGAFSVVLETVFSGISELPFGTFVLLMQPIHLGIGIVEGLITVAAVTFVWNARPELLDRTMAGDSYGNISLKKVAAGFVVIALLAGGILSSFASGNPDGLEWSMLHTSGQEELDSPGGIHQALAVFQEKLAFLPDYSFKSEAAAPAETEIAHSMPLVSAGTSVSGLVGSALTLLLAGMIGFGLRLVKRQA